MRSMMIIKSCYLDANILVYYQDRISPFHNQSKLIIENLIQKGYAIALSSLSLDEYEYTILSSSNKPKQVILKNLKNCLRKLLRIPDIYLINPPIEFKKHLKVLNIMEKYSLKPRDAYHLFIMLENKIKFFATFDNDFVSVFQKKLITKFS